MDVSPFVAMAAGAAILLLPGAAWLAWWPRPRRDALAWLADALALSLALTALVGLISLWLHIRWTQQGLLAAYGICASLTLIGWEYRFLQAVKTAPRPLLSMAGWRAAIPPALGLLIGLAALGGLIAWRHYQARELLMPAWVDSVQHTFVVQKIVENGSLPATLGPELPVPFYYHYGFHLIAAIFTALTGLPAEQTLLWFGGALNALIALAAYRLSVAVWGDWKRAALAGLLVGLAFQMPAYYLTWGRYPLATGLLLLPAALSAALELRAPQPAPGAWLRLFLLTAGVCLTHYLAMLMLAFFYIILLLGEIRRQSRWLPLFTAGLGGLLITAPWLWQVWLYRGTEVGVIPQLGVGQDYIHYILYILGPRHNHILLGAALAGLVLTLIQPGARRFGFWALLLALLTLPWLRLNPFRPDLFAIVLFLPAALLLAHLIFSAGGLLGKWTRPWVGLLLAALIGVSLLGWGAWNTRHIINWVTVFVQPADLAALDWAAENTPPDAKFFINSTGWQGGYRGVDGGYWLLTDTRRQTITPPGLYGMGESPYVTGINALAERASRITGCDADFWSLAADAGLTHLYLREGIGSLQPAALTDCAGLLLIYRRDGVYLYEITGP